MPQIPNENCGHASDGDYSRRHRPVLEGVAPDGNAANHVNEAVNKLPRIREDVFCAHGVVPLNIVIMLHPHAAYHAGWHTIGFCSVLR